MNKQNDRLSFSYGMKLSLPTRYESADFHVSLTSDVGSEETVESAYSRIRNTVLEMVKKSYEEIRNSESGVINENNNISSVAQVSTTAETKENSETSRVISSRSTPEVYRQQVKASLAVLEAKKQVTRPEFVTKYLNNKKLADLSDLEVQESLKTLNTDFPELKLLQ